MIASITVKLVVGLLALLIVIRLLGKKELSQLTPLDFIYILMLGGVLENSIYNNQVTIWHFLYAVFIWALLIYSVEKIVQHFDKTRPMVKGEPTVIIRNGKLNITALKKNDLESEQLRTMLRQKGIFSINEVKYAILEPSGQLSVLKQEKASPVTAEMLSIQPKEVTMSHLVVDEGRVVHQTLKAINKSETWLRNELTKLGYKNIRLIYYAEWSRVDGFTIRRVQE